MRIKKKYVLLESLLIDTSSEFSDSEKRILKLIHKKHKDDGYSFNIYNVAAWLIEDFDLPYEIAFELSKTYFYEGSKLFKESEPLRKKWPIAEIFFSKLGEFTSEFAKFFPGDVYDRIQVKFNGDKGFNDMREVKIWGGHTSLSFWMVFPYYRIYDGFRSTYIEGSSGEARLIRTDIVFKQIDNNGNPIEVNRWKSEEYENGMVNLNEFLVTVNYFVGERVDGETPTNLMTFKVPYPKPLIKQSVMDLLEKVSDDVIQKIQSTTFELPAGEEPIVVSVGSQLD